MFVDLDIVFSSGIFTSRFLLGRHNPSFTGYNPSACYSIVKQ
nr:MAG TPA: hypothetical protein [Caudoviricetes sp.]DAU20622.1 MAG TPA: hypothetical protein [Caudoviricetes sp.]DAX14561.1 MAG TPA: hypothetical protein [Bacteriophage sp.]DAX89465.1 MAG TPA: hypothetical protein [Caudoviricetes sp.]